MTTVPSQDKPGRKRSLNVIYFVDAQKTRSFSIPLNTFRLVSILLLGILFWAGGSIYFVVDAIYNQTVLRDRLNAALTTVFEYQSRYDGVYETAYPENNIKETASHQEVKEKDEPLEPNSETLFIEQKFFSWQGLAIKSSQSDWPINIEDLSIVRDDTDLELSFAIRNTKSPTRADGSIWAIVTMEGRNGEKMFFGSPRDIKIDENGNAINPEKKSNRYSIRYYKAKSFYFTIDETWEGKIINIQIGMIDRSGNQNIIHVVLPDDGKNQVSNETNEQDKFATKLDENENSKN